MIEMGPGLYKVESDSSSKEYIVDLTGAVYSCTCTAWAIGRNRAQGKGLPAPACKHIAQVTAHGGKAVPTVNKQAASKTANQLAALLAELADEPTPEPTPEVTAPPVSTPVEPAAVVVPTEAPPADSKKLAYDALGVILKDAKIAEWLRANDPMAHRQASDAFLALEREYFPVPEIPAPVTLSPAAAHPVCPRCTGFIPTNDNPGAYPGALSRTDNTTYICSACGTDEGMEQFLDGGLTPKASWPISARKYDFPEAVIK